MASFGEVLRQERELRGIELREVAEATKISVRFLQALETDRLDVLPGGIFPRAFVRQYAAYLGLDPDRTVNDFIYAHGQGVAPAGAVGARHPAAHSAASHAPREAGKGRQRLLLAGLGVAAVLGVLAWATMRPEHGSGETAPPPSAPAPSSFAPDQVYPPPTSATTLPAASVGEGFQVGLTAREECWVSVQADGVRVVDRVLAPGETQTVTARAEVVLSVGNAGGVSFTINGRPGVSLGRPGEVRRGVVITRESLPSLTQEPATLAASPGPTG